jgi:hypothetical protein
MLLAYVFFAALKGLCEPMAVYWRLFRLLYSTDNGPKTFPTGSCVTTSIDLSLE